MELTNRNQYTKGQLIEHAQSRSAAARGVVEATESLSLRSYYRRELALYEIALAALAASPVGYINRHTGVFHKPGWMIGDALDAALYFPVFGAHPLIGQLLDGAAAIGNQSDLELGQGDHLTADELNRLIWGLEAHGNMKRTLAGLVELRERRIAEQGGAE